MSPGSRVIVRLPPPTAYLAGLSRTIAFQRDLSSVSPEKSSSRDGREGVPPPPGPASVNESKSATGDVVAALLKANMPIFALAGIAAGRPTPVQLEPSVEYSPVTFVPSERIRSQNVFGKSAGRLVVASAASLRGVAAISW